MQRKEQEQQDIEAKKQAARQQVRVDFYFYTNTMQFVSVGT